MKTIHLIGGPVEQLRATTIGCDVTSINVPKQGKRGFSAVIFKPSGTVFLFADGTTEEVWTPGGVEWRPSWPVGSDTKAKR